MVVDTIASGGSTDTPVWQRIYWCSLEGAVAAALLLAGGLAALQTMTLISALPFTIVLLLLAFGLLKGMRADVARCEEHGYARPAVAVRSATWQARLGGILNQPTQDEMVSFIERTAVPALREVCWELTARDIDCGLATDGESATLTVRSKSTRNFVYGIAPVSHPVMVFSPADASRPDGRRGEAWLARTVFSDGSRGYDVAGFSRGDLIADILAQFERYLLLTSVPSTALYVGSPDPLPST